MSERDLDAAQNDLAAILRAVGLSDAARPYSPSEVVRRDLLPAIAALRARAEQAEADAERYRWLRQKGALNRAAHIAVLTKNGGYVAEEELADAAIDRARSQGDNKCA